MPVDYEILPDQKIVLVTFRGDVTVEDNIQAFLGYAEDPLFDGSYHVLMILASCAFPTAFFGEMARLTFRLEPFYKKRSEVSRTSIFAPGDEAYGMSRMYKSLADERSVHRIDVFRDLDDALAFVGVDKASGIAEAIRSAR